MPDTIVVGLQPSPGEINQRLLDLPERWSSRVLQGVRRAVIELELRVQANLQGKVLHYHSGRLFRSVHPFVDQAPGVITGGVSAGLEAPYGRVHEYGGIFMIPEYQRRTATLHGRVTTMKNAMNALRSRAGRLGVEIGLVDVRAHQAVYPERSFMRTAIEGMRLRFLELMVTACRGLGGMGFEGSDVGE